MMNGREKTPEKPISVVMDDFKNALYSMCQNSVLPERHICLIRCII